VSLTRAADSTATSLSALATQVFADTDGDRKSTRLNSSHVKRISYAVFCLKKKKNKIFFFFFFFLKFYSLFFNLFSLFFVDLLRAKLVRI